MQKMCVGCSWLNWKQKPCYKNYYIGSCPLYEQICIEDVTPNKKVKHIGICDQGRCIKWQEVDGLVWYDAFLILHTVGLKQ